MEMGLSYRLKMQGQNGLVRWIQYQPHLSKLLWEDTQESVSLQAVGLNHDTLSTKDFKPAFALSPENPAKKSKNAHNIKIQLGLLCNYSCAYCNQGQARTTEKGSFREIDEFLAKLSSWFSGGSDGQGSGVRFEFWGGEPFVYFKILKPLGLELKRRYPKASFNIITNASLLNDEIIDWIVEMDTGIGISHDGPGYQDQRGKDPLLDPEKREMIRKLWLKLAPKGRIGFNSVITRKNYSFLAIKEYIGEKLGVHPGSLSLTTEEILLPYDKGGMYLSPQNETEHREVMQQIFWEGISGHAMPVSAVRNKCESFFKAISTGQPSYSFGQKCGMDNEKHIAVDLQGNVLTCQNTSANSEHKLGHIDRFDEVRLTTSYHWSNRTECSRCPVVQLCQGACMFLKNEYWEKACDNSFYWNLSLLGISLFYLTRMVLVEIEGPIMRRDHLPTRYKVIELDGELPPEKYRHLVFMGRPNVPPAMTPDASKTKATAIKSPTTNAAL